MKKATNRIVFLTQYYPPETGAPQNRISDLAQRFHKAGYDVRVLTAKPNYPVGKIYPGFEKSFIQKTEQKGIPVTHCWIYASNKSLIHRLLNYFSFVLTSLIVGVVRLPRADILIVESPPLFLSISGWILSRLKGAKLVLNISDLYPETAISLGILKNRFLIKIFSSLERWSYKVSSLITCQTRGIRRSIKDRFPDRTVHLLTNGIDLGLLQAIDDIEDKPNDDFIIGYAGVIGYAQNLQVILEPARRLMDHPPIQVKIFGEGPEKEGLIAKVAELFLNNIEFPGHLPHSDILRQMRSWDIGLVPLADIALMSGALPSKMFEMMVMCLPILLIAPEGEASAVIEGAKAGIWVKPDSPEVIKEAILRLYGDPDLRNELGNNAYRCVIKDFNRQEIFSKFLDCLYEKKFLIKPGR